VPAFEAKLSVPCGPGASECWSVEPSGASPSPLASSGTFSESSSASGGSAVSGVSSSGLALVSSQSSSQSGSLVGSTGPVPPGGPEGCSGWRSSGSEAGFPGRGCPGWGSAGPGSAGPGSGSGCSPGPGTGVWPGPGSVRAPGSGSDGRRCSDWVFTTLLPPSARESTIQIPAGLVPHAERGVPRSAYSSPIRSQFGSRTSTMHVGLISSAPSSASKSSSPVGSPSSSTGSAPPACAPAKHVAIEALLVGEHADAVPRGIVDLARPGAAGHSPQ
jgi:hypothetical protein